MAELLQSGIVAAMKAIVTMTSRGVVTLPAKLREFLKIGAGQLIAETTADGLLLRPAVTLPVEIYTDERIGEFEGSEAELAAILKRKNLARVDKHRIKAEEYEELPEITDEMLARAEVNKGGRPVSSNPRKLISLRLPADVIERWRKTGPGWQTRMADRLSKLR